METMKKYLSMAALMVVGAIMTGCSSDDNIDNPQQPANKDNVVTLTATVSLDGGAGTRAIDGTTGAKTFESGKQIAVFYEGADGKLKKAVSTDFTPTGDNTKATFTVTLSNPKSGGKIRYIYPSSMAKALDATPPAYPAAATIDDVTINYSGILGSQKGTLETLANYDLAIKDATLSGTDLPASATLTNPLAICKFTLTDGTSPITSSVNKLTICDCTNTYVVTPSSLSEIYVAMKPVSSGNIAFAATTDSKTYFKTKTGATLAASKLYTNITVSMVDAANLIENPAKGQVIGNDGKNYADEAAATAAGAIAVAKIVYVGRNNGEAAPYNHGLALALSDANSGTACRWSTSKTKVHTYNTESSSFASESGLQYNATHNSDTYPAFQAAIANNGTAAPTGCSSWFLASGYQWLEMINATGLSNLGLRESANYWLSTECNADSAWEIGTYSGYWSNYDKGKGLLVRACLAF
jgi:hypothetical protein